MYASAYALVPDACKCIAGAGACRGRVCERVRTRYTPLNSHDMAWSKLLRRALKAPLKTIFK